MRKARESVMNSVKVRDLVIGEGKPKIIVPIAASARKEILDAAKGLDYDRIDAVEWRADWFDEVFDTDKVLDLLQELRAVLKNTPLLMTFRTQAEGGKKEIDKDTYIRLNLVAARSGLVDLVDAEIFTGDDAVRKIIDGAHEAGVKVIASSHDFDRTPSQSDLVGRMQKMQDMNADILKIAVMPENKKDVLTLLAATEEMASDFADRPLITMSMGPMGVISRLAGEVFGSSMTFGCVGKASAPGQIDAADLGIILDKISEVL